MQAPLQHSPAQAVCPVSQQLPSASLPFGHEGEVAELDELDVVTCIDELELGGLLLAEVVSLDVEDCSDCDSELCDVSSLIVEADCDSDVDNGELDGVELSLLNGEELSLLVGVELDVGVLEESSILLESNEGLSLSLSLSDTEEPIELLGLEFGIHAPVSMFPSHSPAQHAPLQICEPTGQHKLPYVALGAQ